MTGWDMPNDDGRGAESGRIGADTGGPAYTDALAVIVVARVDAPDRLAVAVAALRGRIVARVDWTAPPVATAAPRIVAVEAAGIDADTLADRLPVIAEWAAELEATLVIALTPAQIDDVAAVTIGSGAALLVDPDIAECVAALAIGAERARTPAGVFDVGRESDTARFERLNAEVARIAETLARLTRAEQDRDVPPAPIVGDRTQGYGACPDIVRADAGQVRRAIRARRMRDQFLGQALFEDPGWDMLLDLYAAELEQAQVSVSSLCIAAAVAPTTALRWIGRMTDAGLFERRPDPHDRRRAFMGLTRRASEAMHGYMIAIPPCDLAIV